MNASTVRDSLSDGGTLSSAAWKIFRKRWLLLGLVLLPQVLYYLLLDGASFIQFRHNFKLALSLYSAGDSLGLLSFSHYLLYLALHLLILFIGVAVVLVGAWIVTRAASNLSPSAGSSVSKRPFLAFTRISIAIAAVVGVFFITNFLREVLPSSGIEMIAGLLFVFSLRSLTLAYVIIYCVLLYRLSHRSG
ncbi:MAG: hypothetical protein G01um1014106_721 [Parcubacteria group bacterium Gr01-1014_106]|nr:MAG: hypothetical protein G01um1014106_721 [Parcubacteria group bacterium Gr01-1014_106]